MKMDRNTIERQRIVPDIVYTVDETATLLKLNEATVRAYIRAGDLKAARLGKQYRILGKEILKLLEKRTTR